MTESGPCRREIPLHPPSVFTHVLPDECKNYACEIMRVLAPGGRAVVSAFLHDVASGMSPWTFSQQQGDMWVQFPDNPGGLLAVTLRCSDGGSISWPGTRLLGTLQGSKRADPREYPDWLTVPGMPL